MSDDPQKSRMSSEENAEAGESSRMDGMPPQSDSTESGGESRRDAGMRSELPVSAVHAATATLGDPQSSEAPPNAHLLRGIETAIEAGIARGIEAFEKSKQLQTDRLHEDLQQHRTDLVARAAHPVIDALILHSDTIRQNSDAIEKVLSILRKKSADPQSPESDGEHQQNTEAWSEPPVSTARTATAPLGDPESTAAPSATNADLLRGVETAIEAGIDRVLDAFENKLAYDRTKEHQIDRLHEELQQYRTDLMGRTARPLIQAMVHHHDTIGKLLSNLREEPADTQSSDRFFKLLEGLQDDMEIELGKNGIAAYREPNGRFNAKRQKILNTISTHEQELDGTVAESIRPGFEQGIRIIKEEGVSVYKFEPPKSQDTVSPDSFNQSVSPREATEQED